MHGGSDAVKQQEESPKVHSGMARSGRQASLENPQPVAVHNAFNIGL